MLVQDASRLKECALWPGSLFEIAHKHGFLMLNDLEQREKQLAHSDDRTPHENQWLAAIRDTIQLMKGKQ